MTLRARTRDLIKRVEDASGRPALVQANDSLKVLATVSMARGSAPAHVITYNPRGGAAPDYLIAFQCGFILRLFANPAPERFDFTGSSSGRARAREAISASPKVRALELPPATLQQYADQLFDGLMTQLRSVPIGLRIDAWIAADYPDFRNLQETFALRQLQDNQQVLSPEVRRFSVSPIYEASIAINAAFAAFWAKRQV